MRSVFGLALVFSACIVGCGGGGSSSDGVVFQGTVTERGTGHRDAVDDATLKHAAGERIGDVKVCILGECSITDDLGQWGVNVGDFSGGEVSVSLNGHGISTSLVVTIPAAARDIQMELDHRANIVSIARLVLDGQDHTADSHVYPAIAHD